MGIGASVSSYGNISLSDMDILSCPHNLASITLVSDRWIAVHVMWIIQSVDNWIILHG